MQGTAAEELADSGTESLEVMCLSAFPLAAKLVDFFVGFSGNSELG